MKVIVMAAGVGSRLGKLNENKPKCLIKGGEETLIRRIVNICFSRGITDITVVTGYRSDLIRAELGSDVKYVENPCYSTTNSMASLWLARDALHGNVLLMNGDLFYEPGLLDLALMQTRPAVMLADSTRIEDADYRFGFDGECISRYGTGLSNRETDGEYVGIVRLDSHFVPQFKDRLEALIETHRSKSWWEDVLYSFIREGHPINYYDVAGTFWTEVDVLRDFRRLNKWVTDNDIGYRRIPSFPSLEACAGVAP